jgi:FKBP-type peptidyl-prolyl cis-trans isomerase FklB
MNNHFSIATTVLAAVCALLSSGAATAQTPPAEPPATAAPAAPAAPPAAEAAPSPEQMSYLFGLTFGAQLHSRGITNEVSGEALTRGVNDALQGRTPTQPEMRQLQSYVNSVAQAALNRNQQAAADFLAKNAHEKGVIQTASGLQFRILNAGNKKAPAIRDTDEVTVQYRGRLLNGAEFDSSYSRGTPATFPVNGVIKGWQEALVLMKPGAKWQLWVPPALGYGAMNKPGIPAGSLLVFDVDMLTSKSNGAPPQTPGPLGGPASPPH